MARDKWKDIKEWLNFHGDLCEFMNNLRSFKLCWHELKIEPSLKSPKTFLRIFQIKTSIEKDNITLKLLCFWDQKEKTKSVKIIDLQKIEVKQSLFLNLPSVNSQCSKSDWNLRESFSVSEWRQKLNGSASFV